MVCQKGKTNMLLICSLHFVATLCCKNTIFFWKSLNLLKVVIKRLTCPTSLFRLSFGWTPQNINKCCHSKASSNINFPIKHYFWESVKSILFSSLYIGEGHSYISGFLKEHERLIMSRQWSVRKGARYSAGSTL